MTLVRALNQKKGFEKEKVAGPKTVCLRKLGIARVRLA